MLHPHLSAPMTQVPHRLSQQTSFHGHTKRHHRRQQSSGSITSTSRDFSTGRGMNRGSDYPQKQLTRKPRPASSHMPRDKRYSQSKEQSFLHQYPYTHLQDIKKDKKERLTNKEKMYYRRRLLEMQHTNDSSGSNSNPNRTDDINARHFHPLPVNPEDAYAHRYSQTLNAPHYKNKKREVHESRRMQSVNTVDYHPKKSNLDEIVGLAPNDCHWFNYHPHSFNAPRDSTNDWGPNKPQMSSSYHQEIPSGLLGGQQSQFGLNSLESFQQGCLTSLASMLLCPHTILPIMVGLFSNFGSSCDYVQRLGEELVYLKQSNPYYYDQAQIGFSFWPGILPVIIASILGYTLGVLLGWQLGVAVALTATLMYALFFGVILFGVRVKHWSKTIELAETISRYMRGCNLFFNILFYRSPQAPRVAQPVRLLPISINLSNFSTSTEAAAFLAAKMWTSIEQKYGRLAVRLQWASRDVYGESTKTYRKVCCLPSCIWVIVNVITLLCMTTLIAIDNSLAAIENGSSSSTISKIDGDVNALTENFKLLIIICSIISGISLIILIAAITPGVLKLIHGRPFQHPIKKPFYPDLESYTDITMDSCYSSSVRKFHPIPNCIETGQCVGKERGTTCFTHGNYNSNNGTRQLLCSPNKLASTASMAAAVAAAAVTAADRHWRQMGNTKMNDHNHCHYYHNQQNEFDLEANLNEINNTKIVSNSSCHDDDNDDDDDDDENEDSSDESKQSDSSEHSTVEEEEEEDNVSRNDGLLFNSGEFLISGQNIPNSNYKMFGKKHSSIPHQDKDYSKSMENNKRRKTISVERQKNEQLLRQYILDACCVLSMLDRRVGGRQTRLIICVGGKGGMIESSSTNKKLLDFMHLLDHVLMKPPCGGKSYDVPLILAPIGAPEKVMNDVPPYVWLPNVVVIVTANISGISTDESRIPTNNSHHVNDPKQMNPMSSSLRLSSLDPSYAYNFKIWHYIHQLCHLPIYIEDEPTGFSIRDQISEQSFISPARSASNIQHSHETKNDISQPKSLTDMYIGSHELSHFNKKKFRHLLTLTAFMGRMIKLDRLFTQRTIYMSSQKNLAYLNALQYFTNEPSLNTLATWLCFLIHWPFHAAWLSVFIENYQKCEIKERTNYLLNGRHTSRSQPEGLNRTSIDGKMKHYGMEQLGPNLTGLYSRVLKRLGPLIHTVRLKALAASSSPGGILGPPSVAAAAAAVHSNTESFPSAELLASINKTLKLCELAFYDKDPVKLGEFLKSCDSMQMDPKCQQPGSVTISQLVRAMKLTPFLNPQISKWIKEVLLPKWNILENNIEQKEKKPTSSRSSQRSQKHNVKHDLPNPTVVRRESLRSSILKLKETVPKKPLNQFTVDEVCHLVERIVLLTSKPFMNDTMKEMDSSLNKRLSSEESETLINDPIPPAAVNTIVDHGHTSSNIKRYTDSMRKLNITGSVLDLCSLKDLEAKLNMLPTDWKMFCAFIQHLKKTESEETISTKSRKSNEQFTAPYQILPQNHQNTQTQVSSHKSIETDKSSVLSEVRKDQLAMNTVSDTSLTVKSAPLTKDYQFDSELNLVDHGYDKKKDGITTAQIRASKSGDSKHASENNIHVPYFSYTNELPEHSDYPLHHSKMSEGPVHSVLPPCTKYQSRIDPNIITQQSRHMHYNNKINKSQYELRSKPCHDNIHPHSHHKLRNQKSLGSKVICDQNECDCYLHDSAFPDDTGVHRAYTLPHSLQFYHQKQYKPHMHDYASHSSRSPNAAICSRHHMPTAGNNLVPSATMQESLLTDHLEVTSQKCMQCKFPLQTEYHQHYCIHQQCIPDFYNSHHLVNKSAAYLHKTAEFLHRPLDPSNIHNHDNKKITTSATRQFNAAADYPTPCVKDSASTSLAGELGDEVADMSQISNEEENINETFVITDEKLEVRRLKQASIPSTPDAIAYQQPCDCNYWYAHEQQQQQQSHRHLHHDHYPVKQTTDIQNQNSDQIINSAMEREQINSSLDTLSTTTNSSSDNSSTTNLSNENASEHSQLDVNNSVDSCDEITSECSSDNTVNSK
ncbi:unnamed protein product [Trichobilharzia szidati]|nr:unnamed protein product [Trichobilharzia szidati]